MKKQLKKLSLSKKVVANFTEVTGGRPPKTHGQTCAFLTCFDCEPVDTETGFTSYCSVIVCNTQG